MINSIRLSIRIRNNPRFSVLILLIVLVLCTLVYWFAFVKPVNLLELHLLPRLDLTYLYDGGKPLREKFIYAFIILGLLYFLGFHFASQARGKKLWLIVMGGSLLFGMVLLFLYPFDAADIFDNIIRGRISGIYNGNPFFHIPNNFPNDPFLPYSAWKYATSAYGPIWELIARLTAYLAQNGFIASILAFKLISGLFLVATLGIVTLILRERKADNIPALVLLLAWNPVVLYETWGNGHNDMVMVFWILTSVLMLIKRHYTLSILALTIGALIKFIPALLIPAAFLVALKNLTNKKARNQFILSSVILSTLLIGATCLPLWQGVQVFSVERRMRLFSASLPAVFYHVFQQGDEQVGTIIAWVAFCLVVLFSLWEGYKVADKNNELNFPQGIFNILVFYLFVACLWFQQWYVLWLVGLVPVLESRHTRYLALFTSFSVLSKQFIFGPTLLLPHPQYPQPWLEIRFAFGVLAPAWIFAIILWLDQVRMKTVTREIYHLNQFRRENN